MVLSIFLTLGHGACILLYYGHTINRFLHNTANRQAPRPRLPLPPCFGMLQRLREVQRLFLHNVPYPKYPIIILSIFLFNHSLLVISGGLLLSATSTIREHYVIIPSISPSPFSHTFASHPPPGAPRVIVKSPLHINSPLLICC